MAKSKISEMLRARNKATAEAEKINEGFDYMADDVQGTEEFASFGGLAFARPRIINVSVKDLHPFHTRDIGFKPYDHGSLESLAQSIKEDGLMQRIKIRPDPSGEGYEILAGHNRAKAMSEILNQHNIPAELYNVDDDQAAIIAVTTNVKQRHYLRPSERAMAYRALMEAKRHQGKYVADEWGEGVSDDTEEEIATQRTTRDKIAVMFDVDRNNVQRFLRLSYLIPELLEYADNKELSVLAGVQLSYYSEDIQKALAETFKTRTPMTIKVVKAIRKSCPEDTATIESFMQAWDDAERGIEAENTSKETAHAEVAEQNNSPAIPILPEESEGPQESSQSVADAFPALDDNIPVNEDREYSEPSMEPEGTNTDSESDAVNSTTEAEVPKANDSVADITVLSDTLCDKAQAFAVNPNKKLLNEIENIIVQIKAAKNW